MLTQERQDRIVEIVNEKSTVTVGELSEILEASESTVRRDLIRLDRIGLIKKVHGRGDFSGSYFLHCRSGHEHKAQPER